MGWASGSEIFGRIIISVKGTKLRAQERQDLYTDLIEVFEQADCDTLAECLGVDEDFDIAYYSMYPMEDEDDL